MRKAKLFFFIFSMLLSRWLTGYPGVDKMSSFQVPFQLHDEHLIVIKGRIGTLDHLNLIIDTGASWTILDSEVAQRAGLRRGETEMVNSYGGEVKVRKAVVPQLMLGGLTFQEVSVQVAELSFRGMARRIRIDGLIGLNMLRRTSLSIDFEKKIITFGEVSHTDSRFPFYGKLPIIPAPVYIDGKRLTLLLDTGAKHMILYQSKAEGSISMKQTGESQQIYHLGKKATLKQVLLKEAAMGPSRWNEFPAYLLDVRCSESSPDGVLGVASLRLKELNLDFKDNLVSWLN